MLLISGGKLCNVLLFPLFRCAERDFMEATIKKAIVAKDINHKGQGLWVTMRKLLGDFAQVTFAKFCFVYLFLTLLYDLQLIWLDYSVDSIIKFKQGCLFNLLLIVVVSVCNLLYWTYHTCNCLAQTSIQHLFRLFVRRLSSV